MHVDDENIYTLCWFYEEQWNLISKLDPNGVDDSYSQWRKNASKAFLELKENGMKVQKVLVRTAEFSKWCQEKNINLDSKSRAEYAVFLAEERHEKI